MATIAKLCSIVFLLCRQYWELFGEHRPKLTRRVEVEQLLQEVILLHITEFTEPLREIDQLRVSSEVPALMHSELKVDFRLLGCHRKGSVQFHRGRTETHPQRTDLTPRTWAMHHSYDKMCSDSHSISSADP